MTMAGDPPFPEPFPIAVVGERYLLFDVDVVSHLRRAHHICGLLLGSLPQVPQQNVFLGLPLHLMPEEARVLVERGHAYLVDEAAAHRAALLDGGLGAGPWHAYRRALGAQGSEACVAVRRRADERRDAALGRRVAGRRGRQGQGRPSEETAAGLAAPGTADAGVGLVGGGADDAASTTAASGGPAAVVTPFAVTPTTSYPPLEHCVDGPTARLPAVPVSYPLFAHLHRLGYFMMPGLRFGCQYNVYPGDPLRFHSHFLAVGRRWNEEFRMMEIVGGGRLGTGVKKGFMLGGEVEDADGEGQGHVRAFCFEWAGM